MQTLKEEKKNNKIMSNKIEINQINGNNSKNKFTRKI